MPSFRRLEIIVMRNYYTHIIVVTFFIIFRTVGMAQMAPTAKHIDTIIADSFFLDQSPDSGQVTLKLANDSLIYPDDLEAGTWLKKGDWIVMKSEEGSWPYYFFNAQSKNNLLYNTLTVPFRNKYSLLLPDGTHVIIQVGSTLRFPLAFRGKERMVELNGCAFFRIAKEDKRPFVIRTRHLTISSLSARVSVEDYASEPNSTVTAEHGEVKIQSGNEFAKVVAGRSALKSNGRIIFRKANISEELFWKQEYYSFNNLPIRSAIAKLAKCYRMNAVFDENIGSGPFGYGYIQSNLPLDRLLKDLELPDLHFQLRMQDHTIIVKRELSTSVDDSNFIIRILCLLGIH